MTHTTPDNLAGSVRRALESVIDPEIRKPITDLDMVRSVEADGSGAVSIGIALTIVGCPAATAIENDVRRAAEAVEGVADVTIDVGVMTPAERTALIERLRGARREMPFTPQSLTRVITITSGKGGVGKSTITANLAVSLAKRGLTVGLVDADVHGFSIPGLLGLVPGAVDDDGEPLIVTPTRVGDMILPPIAHGVKVISIGMFVDDTQTAVAWRGPMLHRTLNQFLTDVYFGDLDVLLLDLPPGTGDIAISVGQLLPHAEVVVVTTPQPAAADVAERSGRVARQTGQTVVGVIENMAGLTQPDGSVLDLFGSGGGNDVASRLSTDGHSVPMLASVPLSVALRDGGDRGRPLVLDESDDPARAAIEKAADALLRKGRDLAGRTLGLSPR
ncbi:Mrp/NBP35 family ATP-binding protein [Paramicrobacterium fandaimingii]|uniref:Mrp/NBP35 family ATP-binding protein n=1 Tax=Paramicrobacterium fandaimingii TaxID=2708079 RepID=UPI001420CBC4|nr:P-loop NTPase [Microbacterium fandaimingii]